MDCKECTEHLDYDGEVIRTHCPAHCPKVQDGRWPDHCLGC